MGIRHFLSLSLMFVFAGLSISCTRGNDVTTSFKLSLPSNMSKASTQSADRLGYLVVNLDGKLLYAWENRDGNAAVPEFFDVDVPSGKQRMIQVLALYKTEGQSGQTFYYGDATSDIPAPANTVSVNVTNIGGAASESRILGRWVNASHAVQGPTGTITMKFKPPGDKPQMSVHTSEMFGGLFSVFALRELSPGADSGFTYIGPNGEDLFANHLLATRTQTNVDAFATFNAGRAKMVIPAHRRVRNNGGTPSYEIQPQATVIFGWFGTHPTVESRVACLPNADVTVNDAVEPDPNTDPFLWTTTGVLGGTGASLDGTTQLPDCPSIEYTDYLPFDASNVDQDDSMGLRGPYKTKFSGGYRNALEANLAGSSLTVQFEYAPNVVRDAANSLVGLDGTEFLYRVVDVNYYGGDDYQEAGSDGPNCGKLLKDGKFKLLGTVPADKNNLSVTHAFNSLSTDFVSAFNGGKIQLLGCPFQSIPDKKYFSSTIDFKSYPVYVVPTMPAPQKFLVSNFSGAANLTWANGQCVPFVLSAVTSAGLPAQLPPKDQIVITTTGTSTSFYVHTCTSPGEYWTGGQSPMTFGNYSYIVWLKRTTTGAQSATVSFASAANGITAASNTFNFAFADAQTPTRVPSIKTITPATAKTHACMPIAFLALSDKGGVTQMLPTGLDVNLDWSTDPDISFFTDPFCSNSAGVGITFYAAQLMSPTFYYRTTAPGTITAPVTLSSSFPGGSVLATNISVTAPGALSKLNVYASPNMLAGSCYLVMVRAEDNMGNVVAPASSVTASLDLMGGLQGTFSAFTSPNCSCGAGSGSFAISIAAPSTTVPVCFKAGSASSGSLALNSIAPTLQSNPSPAVINIPPPSQFRVFQDITQAYDPSGAGGYTGAANLSVSGPAVQLNIVATYYDGINSPIATNYNGTGQISSVNNITGIADMQTVTFVNGIATVMVDAGTTGTAGFSISGPAPSYPSGFFSVIAGP